MSDHQELMDEVAELRVRMDWLVEATKYLLKKQDLPGADDLLLTDPGMMDDPDLAGDEEVRAMLAQPDPPPPIGCPASPTGTHTGQVLIKGNLCCANCGGLLIAGTGIKEQNQRAQWLAQPENRGG